MMNKAPVFFCLLLASSAARAQSQDEAKRFLEGAFKDSGGKISCNEIVIDPTGRFYRFDPKAVTLKEFRWSDGRVAENSVVIECIAGACILTAEEADGKKELVGKGNPIYEWDSVRARYTCI